MLVPAGLCCEDALSRAAVLTYSCCGREKDCQKGGAVAQKGKHFLIQLKLMLIKIRNRLQEGDGSVNQHNIRQGTGNAPLGSVPV